MNTKHLRIPLALIILLSLASLTGCESIQTGIAQVIGAPTPAQVRDVEAKLDQLATAEQQLAAAKDQAIAAKQEQDKAVQLNQARDATLKKQISEVAQQLASASGEAYDWLTDALHKLQAQRQALQAGIDESLTLASRWQAEIDKIDQALASTHTARQQAQAKLSGFADQRQQAIEGATDGIKLIGQATQDLGVPGAGPIGDRVAAYAGGLLALVLGGYAAKQRINATNATTAAQEIVGSFETARRAVPALDEGIKQASGVLNSYQSTAAKKLVDQVQAEIKSNSKTAA